MVATQEYGRLLRAPKRSFFLFGPRGTGKSTWIRRQFPGAKRFDLLDEGVYQAHLSQPGLLGAQLRTLEPGSWVVIDEVQRLPQLLNEAHRAIEEHGLKFVLCGSSARKLKTAGTNLLAGRALQRRMFPFVPQELGEDFELSRALAFGTLPVVWTSDEPHEVLAAYVQTYLKEEIQAEALARNLPGFARFLPVAALFHGQVINVSSLARDAGVARTTVAGYLDILEDTLVAFRLPAFEGRLRVRERKLPKLYWADPGIVRALKRQLGPLALEERGALLEGFVAGLLRAYGSYRDLYDELYYWSPLESASAEVDFLLQRGPSFVAVEVKSSTRFRPDMLAGLRAIGPLRGLRRRIAVYGGSVRLRTEDGVDVVPVGELVREVGEGRVWDG
jgi:predicted AAA+ superfamily ATPase